MVQPATRGHEDRPGAGFCSAAGIARTRMQPARKPTSPIRIAIYVAAGLVMLAAAAGVGALAALVVGDGAGSPRPAKHEQGEPRQTGAQGSDRSNEGDSGRLSEAEYLREVANIQGSAVEASLESNAKLRAYDNLTADDIEDMKANYRELEDYRDRVRELDPPEDYEGQHKIFALALDELRDADELAYRLGADPASATQADFEAYDRNVDKATTYLQQSNEILGRNYKTTDGAEDVTFG